MRYRQRVTFEAATEVRSPTGAVSYSYEPVDGLTDLPASKGPVRFDEQRQDRAQPTEEFIDFLIAGDHRDIDDSMAIVDAEGVYDVVRLVFGTLRDSTLVVARVVAL